MLPKKNRLTSDYDFRMVRRRGKKVRTSLFDLYYLEIKGGALSRFGFVVSTKLDKRAVRRNRVKRIFREGIKPILPKIKDGFDFVFWARRKSLEAESEQVRMAIRTALKKARLLTND